MLTVGLTGGIGAGKSTVAARLVARGARLIDADVLAREVVAPGTDGLAEIVAVFGRGVLGVDGVLDRAALASIVFADPASRQRLNAIVHPRVRARTAQELAATPADAVVVNDGPLLTEGDLGGEYHLVVVVETTGEERLRRLRSARGMSAAEARARIASQATDEQRRAIADVVIDNSGGREATDRDVDVLWTQRLAPFAANLNSGVPAPRPKVRIIDHDPTWAVQARRLAARIERAVGGGRVEHIGSTAVPGLGAEDVIDLMLAAPSPDAAEAWAPALAAAGFVPVGDARDTLHTPVDTLVRAGGSPATDRGKRLHANADPGRAVNLHVLVEGCLGWTAALLLRDLLRADAAERDRYVVAKRDLARRFPDPGDYAQAKEAWFAGAFDRAAQWARQTG
jgi:dephospho-CoA kinase